MIEANYSIIAFFVFATVSTAYLGYKFYQSNISALRYFGLGSWLASLTFLIWIYVVTLRTSEAQFVAIVAAVPLLAAFTCFMLSAATSVKARYRFPLILISSVILIGFVLSRFLLYKANPLLTDRGFIDFNTAPVVLYFYALMFSFSLIPAIYVVGRHIKYDLFRIFFEVGLTLVSIGLVVMATSADETLQIVNGTGISLGLLAAAGSTAVYGLGKDVIKK